MTAQNWQVRRATIEDKEALLALWKTMGFPLETLEKRLTEFQVAVSPEGVLLGAIGLQINGKHGCIHSEAFSDFALADKLRESLWERLQSVATNHGLVRVWTMESAPFWKQNGLSRPTDEELSKLPGAWSAQESPEQWLTLKLREDIDEALDLDKEFKVFMESERQESQRMVEQAKMLKVVVTLMALLLFAAVIAFGIFVMQRNPGLLHR